MPGYVIHLATANEYIKKHPNQILNKSEFLLGSISPDFTTKEKKGNTHYGESSSVLYLRKYLENNNLDTDFNRGYFLHLVTDYLFYNKLIKCVSKEIYNDYDILNKYLMEKYDVELQDEIKGTVFFKEGTTKILSKEIAEKIINLASEYDLYEIREEIINTKYIDKWDKIRRLKHLD